MDHHIIDRHASTAPESLGESQRVSVPSHESTDFSQVECDLDPARHVHNRGTAPTPPSIPSQNHSKPRNVALRENPRPFCENSGQFVSSGCQGWDGELQPWITQLQVQGGSVGRAHPHPHSVPSLMNLWITQSFINLEQAMETPRFLFQKRQNEKAKNAHLLSRERLKHDHRSVISWCSRK